MQFAITAKLRNFQFVFCLAEITGIGIKPRYKKYMIIDGKDCETAAKSSAKDVGMLLKTVLEEDSRNFEIVRIDTGKVYKLA